MKIIFSRKGFDSAYGGGASPILPSGELLSMPIPASENEQGIRYDSLFYNEKNYAEWLAGLNLKPDREICHHDPDLMLKTRNRPDGWQTGVFGQAGAAATHLENEEVEVNDLFLFFGSFRRTWEHNGKIQFEKDFVRHIIFGYLFIEKILRTTVEVENHPFLETHPHFQNREKYKPNQIYLAAKIWENGYPGFGNFHYNEHLVLTRPGFSKSIWILPSCFHPDTGAKVSRHSKERFRHFSNQTILETVGIGQDFVVSGNREIETWAKNLIKSSRVVAG